MCRPVLPYHIVDRTRNDVREETCSMLLLSYRPITLTFFTSDNFKNNIVYIYIQQRMDNLNNLDINPKSVDFGILPRKIVV